MAAEQERAATDEVPFRDIIALTSDAVIVTEAHPIAVPGPRIVYVNQAFTDISGYTLAEVLGRTPRVLQGPRTDKTTRARIHAALDREESIRATVLNYHKSGYEYWLDLNIYPLRDAGGTLIYYAAIERDITEIKRYENELKEQATVDPLTGVLNRRGFSERAESLLRRSVDARVEAAVMIVDIDHFKRVNDNHGHEAGDSVLRELGTLLRETVRDDDIVGRLGGEEFAIVLGETTPRDALLVAEKLRERTERHPFVTRRGTIQCTVSIGLATTERSWSRLSDILQQADRALYEAKEKGRNCVRQAPWPVTF